MLANSTTEEPVLFLYTVIDIFWRLLFQQTRLRVHTVGNNSQKKPRDLPHVILYKCYYTISWHYGIVLDLMLQCYSKYLVEVGNKYALPGRPLNKASSTKISAHSHMSIS